MREVKYTAKVVKKHDRYSVEIPKDQREAMQKVFAFCHEKRNSHVFIQVAPPKRPRSKGQQGLLHDWLQDIAVFTGNEIGHVKMAMKIMAMSEGWPRAQKLDGSPIIDLITGEPLPMSEALASVEEETILLSVVRRFAAEHRIYLRKDAA